ncbi:MAG: mannose-6-phosphate isomerase, class I, partial [Candidatus Omnitrophica bacterium]|nr:mannose-6-phosphate isomerase, class I [Candidatus Omnitrophota bacterium]
IISKKKALSVGAVILNRLDIRLLQNSQVYGGLSVAGDQTSAAADRFIRSSSPLSVRNASGTQAIPVPMVSVFSKGKKIQLAAVGYRTFKEAIQALRKAIEVTKQPLEEISGADDISLQKTMELLNKILNETQGAEGVFIILDMDAGSLRRADGKYYLGVDAERFGSEAEEGFVRHQLLLEFYQILATDYARLIVITNAFAQDDHEAWKASKDALGEVTLTLPESFEFIPEETVGNEAGPIGNILEDTVAFAGEAFLMDPQVRVEFRVQRVTLGSLMKRASLSTAGKAQSAAYPQGSLRSILKYLPKHTGMGTSGFRGSVDDMRDFEPYAISSGFIGWLIKRKQLTTDAQGRLNPGQYLVLAGDFRDSTPEFTAAAMRAITDAGLKIDYLGNVATPTMAYYCQLTGRAGIMITGSHTEGKYNGLKLYDLDGEVLNEAEPEDEESDRTEIMQSAEDERQRLYSQQAEESLFDENGYFKSGNKPRVEDIEVNEEARNVYLRRYQDAFVRKPLSGYAVVYWVQSTVAASDHIAILESLGAKVIRVGERGKAFVALDTENMTPAHLTYLEEQVETTKAQYQAQSRQDGKVAITIDGSEYVLLGLVSSDGDGDRSVIVDENGRFWRGDVTGAIVAETLAADIFIQSLTGNQDVRDYLPEAHPSVVVRDCSVGSPYHVFVMRSLLREDSGLKLIAHEVNGGTFIGPNFTIGDVSIEPLMTRDAILPELIVFKRALRDNLPISKLFEGRLDHYADSAGLIHEMPVPPGTERTGKRILARYTPDPQYNVKDVLFDDAQETLKVTLRGRGDEVIHSYASELGQLLLSLRKDMQGFFNAERGFGNIRRMAFGDRIDDGIVMWDEYDRYHVRPSGNAPETRIYVYSSQGTERAVQIVALCVEAGGILQEMERTVLSAQEIFDYLDMAQASSPAKIFETFRAAPHPFIIRCEVMDYEWGDPHYIPNLLGTEPSGKPQAELWIGAHPKAPAKAKIPFGTRTCKIPLDRLIREVPDIILGDVVASRFRSALPYLFKVLTAATALSIQAHPNKAQAEEGFARENAAGIEVSAGNRSYKDDNHKPEIICALTPFWALNGFRNIEQIIQSLVTFDIPQIKTELGSFIDDLRMAGYDAQTRREALRKFYAGLMNKVEVLKKAQAAKDQAAVDATQAAITPIITHVVERSREAVIRLLELPDTRDTQELIRQAQRQGKINVLKRELWALRLNELYPNDMGVLSVYLLNLVRLEPGQAMYLPAGELHAYLGKLNPQETNEGAGIELMANSDNVLRGGLTPKHVDVPELLKTLTFNSGDAAILTPEEISELEGVYGTDSPEFQLSAITLTRQTNYISARGHSADALLVVEGSIKLIDAKRSILELKKGETAIIPAGVGQYAIKTKDERARIFKASVPVGADASSPLGALVKISLMIRLLHNSTIGDLSVAGDQINAGTDRILRTSSPVDVPRLLPSELAEVINRRETGIYDAIATSWRHKMSVGSIFKYTLSDLKRKEVGRLAAMFNPRRVGKRPAQMETSSLSQPFDA